MGAAALPLAMVTMGAGGLYSAQAERKAGEMQDDYYKSLASTAKSNAELSEATGEAEAKQIGVEQGFKQEQLSRSSRAMIGAQKAALAAGGAGVGSKTGEQLVSDTLDTANLDEMALNYNANMKANNARLSARTAAFNYRTQAEGDIIAGRNARAIGKSKAIGTLLGTAGQMAGTYASYRKAR